MLPGCLTNACRRIVSSPSAACLRQHSTACDPPFFSQVRHSCLTFAVRGQARQMPWIFVLATIISSRSTWTSPNGGIFVVSRLGLINSGLTREQVSEGHHPFRRTYSAAF